LFDIGVEVRFGNIDPLVNLDCRDLLLSEMVINVVPCDLGEPGPDRTERPVSVERHVGLQEDLLGKLRGRFPVSYTLIDKTENVASVLSEQSLETMIFLLD
jgi:hypothetical protein